MESSKIKRVRPSELQSNMVLARDIVTDAGQLVVARETPARDIPESALRNVEYVHVRVLTAQEMLELLPSVPEKPVALAQTYTYKNFERLYDEASEKTKEYVTAICSGENVFVADLCEMPNKIMESLVNKSDVFAYIGAIKDKNTFTHSNNVSLLCNLFGYWLDLSDDDIDTLTLAGMLHDIGKTRIAPDLLPVGEPKNERESSAIRRHPQYGYNLLDTPDFPEEVKLAALMHHERYDGSGYPSGLKGDKIADTAKIVQICNAYENALHGPTGDGKRCPFDVIKEFEREGYAVMDAKYLWVFLNQVANCFVGHWVQLSDGQVAKVFFINQKDLSRPIVQTSDGEAIDLSSNRELFVKNIL